MKIENLPSIIAVFPLSNAVFFPKTILPLNIFEERYIQLINDCMKGQRLFGMTQPKSKSFSKPEIYEVGCLGKIVSFNETNDKRFLITLSGITRFRIIEELTTDKMYREFNVNYSDFNEDIDANKNNIQEGDIKNLLNKIKFFLEKKNYVIEFKELKKLNYYQLINTLCVISPFSLEEKQKLVETITIKERLKVLEEITNFNLFDGFESKTVQ